MHIFVHFPKAGGSSIRAALKKAYGKRLFEDYDYRALPEYTSPDYKKIRERVHEEAKQKRGELEAKYDVIYGHFRADKYNFFGESARRSIIFREPISRLCSEYYYHIKMDSFKKRKQEGISLLEFAELPDQINYYNTYLGGLPLEQFDFVGLVELLPLSIELYRRKYGILLDVPVENKGNISDHFGHLRSLKVLDDIARIQAKNFEVYRAALDRFSSLWQESLLVQNQEKN